MYETLTSNFEHNSISLHIKKKKKTFGISSIFVHVENDLGVYCDFLRTHIIDYSGRETICIFVH